MTVKVTFPDGSEREVPSRTKVQQSREIPDTGPTFSEEPLPDPDYEFYKVIGAWRARLKH